MARKAKPEWTPLVTPIDPGVPLEELEQRLEMQNIPVLESALACYTDLCPGDCTNFCTAGYSGCTDLCSCDGSNCLGECETLCAVDSCLVDIF